MNLARACRHPGPRHLSERRPRRMGRELGRAAGVAAGAGSRRPRRSLRADPGRPDHRPDGAAERRRFGAAAPASPINTVRRRSSSPRRASPCCAAARAIASAPIRLGGAARGSVPTGFARVERSDPDAHDGLRSPAHRDLFQGPPRLHLPHGGRSAGGALAARRLHADASFVSTASPPTLQLSGLPDGGGSSGVPERPG